MEISELERNIDSIIKEGSFSDSKKTQIIKKRTYKKTVRKNKKKEINENKKITQFYLKRESSQEESHEPIQIFTKREEKDKLYYFKGKDQQSSLKREVAQINKLIQAVDPQTRRIFRQKSEFLSNLSRAKIQNIKQYHEILRQEREVGCFQKGYCGEQATEVRLLPENLLLEQTQQVLVKKNALLRQMESNLDRYKPHHRHALEEEIIALQEEEQLIMQQQKDHQCERYLLRAEESSRFCQERWPLLENRYQTVELLGIGGYSEVYKAFDVITNSYVAIKLCSVEDKALVDQEIYMTHLKKECQTHLQLRHPNIVRLKEVILVDETSLALVLDLCEGQQLSRFMKSQGKLSESVAKELIFQVFEVIYYLNNRYDGDKKLNTIVHYDIKPQNILFTDEKFTKIKVIDFGLTKQLTEEQTKGEITSQGMGTFAYLPPQIYDNTHEFMLNNKIDVWSAGVIFYEMLYGERPKLSEILHGDIFTPQNQTGKIKEEVCPDVECRDFAMLDEFSNFEQRKVEISDEAKEMIKRCLQTDPKLRITPNQAYWGHYFSEFQRKKYGPNIPEQIFQNRSIELLHRIL